MIVGLENIMQWFVEQGNPYYKVFYMNKVESGQTVFQSEDIDELPMSQATDTLRRRLQMLDRGSYTIISSPGKKSTGRGSAKVNFELTNSGTAAVGNIPQPAGLTQADVTDAVNKAIAAYKAEEETKRLKEENAQLQKELKELQRETAEPWNQIAGVVANLAPQLFGSPAAVAGIPAPAPVATNQPTTDMPQENEIEITDDQHARLEKVVAVFVANRPADWLETLEKMAAKVQSNPGIVDTLKMFL